MQRLLSLALLIALCSASKCSPNPPTPDAAPVPTPVADAAPAPIGPPSCATACANQIKLGCTPASTPGGASCIQVCTNAAATVPWDVVGLTAAKGCP